MRSVSKSDFAACFFCDLFGLQLLCVGDKKIENDPEIPTQPDPTRNASLWYPFDPVSPHHVVNYVRLKDDSMALENCAFLSERIRKEKGFATRVSRSAWLSCLEARLCLTRRFRSYS